MGVQADSIEVGIESSASKAVAELDKFISKLNQVESSIRSINGGGMSSLANGVKQLSGAMQGISGIKTADFSRLSRNLEKLGGANAAGIYQMAGSLRSFSSATKSITGISENAVQIGELAKNISRFGYKGAQNAVANLPALTTELNRMMTVLSKSPRVSNNLIQMTNALANLSAQGGRMKGVSSSLGTVDKRLKAYSLSASRASKNTLSLSAAFGKFYASCFLVIRGVKSIGKAITNSMDYIESYNYFNVITDKIGSEFGSAWKENGYSNAQDYIGSFKERLNNLTSQMTGFTIGEEGGLYLSDNLGLGLDPNAIMNFQAQISSITNAAKLVGETSINASKALTMLSADLSSLKNQDLQSVMENLQSGLVGQSEALYKYGIDITNTTLQQYAYANGISKSVSEMTQAEKMQLRLLAILDQTKVAYGDMASTIDGVANQYRILKQQVANLSRIIGNLFIPMLQAVLPYLNGIVIALQRFFTWIGNLMGIKWDSLMDGVSSGYTDTGLEALNQDADGVTDSLEDANKAANKLKNTIHSYDELHIATDNSQDDTSIGGSNGIDLSKQIADALADYEDVWNKAMSKMENRAQEIADKISAYFKKIHDAWKKDADMSFVGEDLGNAINNLLSSIDWESVREIGYKLGKSISTALSGFLRTTDWNLVGTSIAEALNTLIQFLKGAIENFDFSALGKAIGDTISGFFANFDFKALARTLNKFVDGLKTALKEAIKNTSWKDVFVGLSDFFDYIELDTVTFIVGAVAFKKFGKSILESLTKWVWSGISGSAIKLGKLSLSLEGLNFIGATINPGMIGELGLTIERFLQGSIFDTSTWSGLPQRINDLFNSMIDFVGEGIVSAFGAIGEILVNTFNWDSTMQLFESARENFEKGGLYIVQGIIEGMLGAIGFIVEPIGDFFTGVWNALCDFFGIHSPATSMYPIGEYIMLGIVEGFKGKFNESIAAVKEWYEKIKGSLSDSVTSLVDNVATWFAEMPGRIYNSIIPFFEKAREWSSNVKKIFEEKSKEIITNVVGFFKALPGNLYDAIKGFFQKIRDWAQESISVVRSTVPRIIESITNVFTSLPNKLYTIGQQALQGFSNGMQSMFSSIWNTVSSFASRVISTISSVLRIHSPSRVMFELGEFTIEGYENGLKNLFGDVYDTLSNFSERIKGEISLDTSVIVPQIQPMDYSINPSAVSQNSAPGGIQSAIEQAIVGGVMDVFMATQNNSGSQNSDRPIQIVLDRRVIAESTYKELEDMAMRGEIPAII